MKKEPVKTRKVKAAIARPNYKKQYEDLNTQYNSVLERFAELDLECKQWKQKCTTNTDNLQKALDAANDRIVQLKADIDRSEKERDNYYYKYVELERKFETAATKDNAILIQDLFNELSPEEQNAMLQAFITAMAAQRSEAIKTAEKNRHEFETILKN